ncbi:retrovirus-related pol polyprotein from transposon TNT 1-94 [Tanacetum coccineum]
MIIKKDSEIVKVKGERKSLTLKAKKESSDEENLTSKSEDEEYAMTVRDFKKIFQRRRRFDKNQRAFVEGSWSDSGEKDDERLKTKRVSWLKHLARDKPGLGFNSFEASTSETKKTEFVKSQNETSLGGGPMIADGGSLSVQTAPNINQGPPVKKPGDKICLVTIDENSTLWHRILGHTKIYVIQSLASKELVRNLPKLKFGQHFCDACKIGKQAHDSHKAKTVVSTTSVTPPDLQRSRIQHWGVWSYRGNLYTLVIVDDYSRTDHGKEIDNEVQYEEFCNANEPKNMNEALKDESWIIVMQEELKQFFANDVWELAPHPKSTTIIGTKLVAQGYNQQEGIDYDETYAHVARLESIRILLAYACVLNFMLFQMDVKSAFLNGFINEEVYVAQPLGFIDFEKPNHVYKLKKALYGLKQAPKAWYDRLKAFLIKHEYNMGMVDNTLFTKKKGSNLIIVQIYVDDIIFGSTCQELCDDFAKIMHDEFEMSMMGELNFFLGLQIKQMEDGIFFNQSKYIKEMLKKFSLEDSKPMKTPMSSDTKLTKDEECESVDSTKYQGMIGCCLTSWFSKKQTALAISITETEYVSTGKACQQALWMKQALIDYDIQLDDVPIMCDNKGAIDVELLDDKPDKDGLMGFTSL